jgi:3alpha(or 20beta)-hydroxysteroid dehydrogenase
MGDRLKGKVALVTGGARGQGEAEARCFVAEGARVFVGDVLREAGEKLAAELGEAAVFLELDVSSERDWARALERILAREGRIDVLVNNAALTLIRPAAETTPEEFHRVCEVNQFGVHLGMRAVYGPMSKQRSGSIVNISSLAGQYGQEGQFAYSASKAAVLAMTRVAAREWGPLGIRVNSILPGAIDTPMLRGPHTEGIDIDALLSGLPLGRAGHPSEIAAAALFLASDESSYVTGAGFEVDGGLRACMSLPPPRVQATGRP